MSLLDLVSGAIRLGKAIKQAVDDKKEADEQCDAVSDKVEALLAPVESLNVASIPANRAFVFRKALENLSKTLSEVNDFVGE